MVLTLLTALLFFVSSEAFAKATNPALEYTLNASFIHTDILKRPESLSDFRMPKKYSKYALATRKPRTLGLRGISADLSWSSDNLAKLHLGLRPDALVNRSADPTLPTRDYDSRSGSPYRKKPILNFLQSYHIEYSRSENFAIRVGVFENVIAPQLAYLSFIEFGLGTYFPQNFFGIELNWKNNNELAYTQNYRLFLVSGRNDRGEILRQSTDSFDTAPTATDPYTGLALNARFDRTNDVSYEITFGYGDERITGGMVNEIYGSLAALASTQLFQRPTYMGIELRYAKERWQLNEGRFSPLSQSSLAITSRTIIKPDMALLTGLHFGNSERHITNRPDQRKKVTGWQLDCGIQQILGNGIHLIAMTTLENREVLEQGIKKGAFVRSGSHRKLNRFSIGANFELASSH